MGNKTLSKLKKNIGIPIDEVKSFWEKHPVYKLLKPKSHDTLLIWVKAMFYNRTFMEAYSTTTRAMMTLRIPKYVGRPMIVETVELEKHYEKKHKWGTKIMTMIEYYEKMMLQFDNHITSWSKNDEIHLSRIITKCDPTVTQIYSILDTISISLTDMTRKQTIQVSAQQPRKTTTLSLVNDPAILLQYITDYDCFLLDKRRVKSRGSLEKDVILIKEKYWPELREAQNTMALLSIYNDLMITKQAQNVIYTYDRNCVTLLDFIMSSFRNNFHPGFLCKVTNTNVGSIIDPTTLKTLFLKQHRHTKDYHRQCLDNICLIHVFLTHTQQLKKKDVLQILGCIKFEMPGGTIVGYKDILSNITEDYMIINEFTLTERKIASYLCAYYMNNYDSLEDLVNNHYSFSYRYNQKAFKRGNTYVGQTVLTFTHFNTVVRAYHNTLYGDPIIVMQKHYPTASPTLYNIALRLTDCIKQTLYEEDPTFDRRKLLSGAELKKKIDNLNIPNVHQVVRPGPNGYDDYVKQAKIKPYDYYYPVLISSKPMAREGRHHFSRQVAHPNLENDNLLVTLGKSKLFVLPYWRCNQYDNMSADEMEINGVPLCELLKERRIEYYLLSTNKLRNTTEIKNTHPTEYTIMRIKDHIRGQKIYDFQFGDIIRGAKNYTQWLNADGKEKIDGNFIVSSFRDPIDVESDEEAIIDIPHFYPTSPKEEHPKLCSDGFLGFDLKSDFLCDENTFPTLSEEGFLGTPLDSSFLMDFEEGNPGSWESEKYEPEVPTQSCTKQVSLYTPEDDYEYKNELEENDFKIDMGEQEKMFEGKIIDDVNNDLNEGLNYHFKEYIGEDVYHKEIHGKIMDDKFLIDPRTKKRVQRTWKRNEYSFYSQMGSNYMVLRLKRIPDYYMTMAMHQRRIPLGYDLMNIYSFKQNLQQIIDLLNQSELNDFSIEDQLMLWFYLEKLLCRTYIVDSLTYKQSVGFAYDTNHKIHLGVWTDARGRYTMEQKKDMLQRGKILAIDEDHVLIRTTLERFEKQVEVGLKTGLLTHQPLLLSIKYDKQMTELMLRLSSTGTEDLLDMLN